MRGVIKDVGSEENKMDVHFTACRNSCALDSVLVALSGTSNVISKKLHQRFINRYNSREITRLETWLLSIEDHKTIQDFRPLLPHHEDSFSIEGTKDAIEFLAFFLSLFPDEAYCETRQFNSIVGLGQVISTRQVKDGSPIQHVPTFNLEEVMEHTSLETFTTLQTTNSFPPDQLYLDKYNMVIVTETLLSPSIMIFGIQRMGIDGFKDKDLEIPEHIGPLNLVAVVCYVFGHYTSQIKVHDQWYFYDDLREDKVKIDPPIQSSRSMSSEPSSISSSSISSSMLPNMIPSIGKYGVLYFYSG